MNLKIAIFAMLLGGGYIVMGNDRPQIVGIAERFWTAYACIRACRDGAKLAIALIYTWVQRVCKRLIT